MICSDCGEELVFLFNLSDDEIKELTLLRNDYALIDNELKIGNARDLSFDSDEVTKNFYKDYYSRYADIKARDVILYNKILRNHNLMIGSRIKLSDTAAYCHKSDI